ncbi:taste receptor type 2 member 41-like [Engystomops pustulosus]|uniref:taste receptor type 2 member 41-like n=1 Tax=Engystomops pustulosus TaxID=76066 RepID=UPI003AFA48AB
MRYSEMDLWKMVTLLFYFMTCSSGIYFNAFIAVVSCRTWLRDGLHHPQGLLLFSIGLSSAIFESYQILISVSAVIWKFSFSSLNFCTIFSLCIFTFCIFFSLCQISWLCSFYCIKLVSFQHWIIQVLKSRLPSILPWIMACTLVTSSLVLIVLSGVIYTSVPVDNTDHSSFCRTINDTYIVQITAIVNGFNIIMALPFSLILVSLSCTVSTLVRHIRRLQGTFSLEKSHLEAHIAAVKTMILLLMLNMSFYGSKLLVDWVVLPLPLNFISNVIYFSFWPLQALTLIFRTKKLHRSFIWCHLRRSSE